MENLVESFLRKAKLVKGENYFKEMYIHEIEENGVLIYLLYQIMEVQKRGLILS